MRSTSKAPAWLVDLALVTVVGLWSFNFVILKAVLPRFDPLALAALRFVGIAALFELLLRARRVEGRLAPADRRTFVLSALVGYTLYQGFFILGLHRGTAFSTALMINTGPVWAALILTLWGLERVGRWQWVGILLAFVGLVFYVGPRLLARGGGGVGDLLALGAAVSWSCYGIVNKPLLERYGAFYLTTRTFQIGAALFLPFAAVALLGQDWGGIGAAGWAALAYSVAFPIVVAVSLWNWAIGQRGVSRTVVYQYLMPVMCGLLAWLFLDEPFTAQKVTGAGLILAGVILSRKG
ncbi:MAG: DMT family transporter [Deferrisomatales bacterium]